ncbi:MAG: flippase-like domain-containing protein [Opitutae bacterium]|nr:flippase-like domain-containing protein [Opitutae bacterium]
MPEGPANPTISGIKSKLKVIIPVLGLVAILGVLMHKVEWAHFWKSLSNAKPKWIACAFGVAAMQPLLVALRLNIYLKASQIPKAYGRCLSAVLAAMSLNAVLPARGGDFIKVTFLENELKKLPPMVGVTILERVFDILILCILAFIGSIVTENQVATKLSLLALCAPIGALLALNFADRIPVIGKKLKSLAQACRTAMKAPGLLIYGWGVASVCWISNLLVMFLLFKAVDANLEFTTVVATMPLAILVGILPLSISGMGTRDGAMVFLLEKMVESGTVLAGTFLYTAAVYWFLAIIGLVFLGKESLRKIVGQTRLNQEKLKAEPAKIKKP